MEQEPIHFEGGDAVSAMEVQQHLAVPFPVLKIVLRVWREPQSQGDTALAGETDNGLQSVWEPIPVDGPEFRG